MLEDGQPTETTTQQKPVDAPAEDQSYKARYDGLNKTYQTHRSQWESEKVAKDGLIADFTAKQKDWESKNAEFQKLITSKDAAFAALEKDRAEADTRAATLIKRVQRQDLFMAKYPDLAGFDAEGLLRTDLEGEELDGYLSKMQGRLGTLRKDALDDVMSGATPSTAPGTRDDGKLDKETMFKQLNDAIEKNDMAAYNNLLPQWLKLSN
jgi:hypothetical protein